MFMHLRRHFSWFFRRITAAGRKTSSPSDSKTDKFFRPSFVVVVAVVVVIIGG